MRNLSMLSVLVAFFVCISAAAAPARDGKVISDATQGQMKAAQGKYFNKECNESVQYEAQVIDLNTDGQPEVFTKEYSSCLGGGAGVRMDLLIKNKSSKWNRQFGFPGEYKILRSVSRGYPDVEIGGPGMCFPVWRWNGTQYAIYKKCP